MRFLSICVHTKAVFADGDIDIGCPLYAYQMMHNLCM